MGILELLLLAVGLAMDAFAVAICKGLAMERITLKEMAVVGLWFGAFQGLMPALGWLLGSAFEQYIVAFDHWVAFILLGLIGFNMIREALDREEEHADGSLAFRTMLVLAVATSIDALAVGISLAMAGDVNIWLSILLIGLTTFSFSALGVKIGNVFGSRFEKKAQIAGGIILILLGLKILLEHLGVLA